MELARELFEQVLFALGVVFILGNTIGALWGAYTIYTHEHPISEDVSENDSENHPGPDPGNPFYW